jgi:hypothetical protein
VKLYSFANIRSLVFIPKETVFLSSYTPNRKRFQLTSFGLMAIAMFDDDNKGLIIKQFTTI